MTGSSSIFRTVAFTLSCASCLYRQPHIWYGQKPICLTPMRNTYEDRCHIRVIIRLTLRCLRFLYIYARYRLKMHNYAEHASREYLFFVHKILLMKIRSFFGGYAKPLSVSVMWSFVICLRLSCAAGKPFPWCHMGFSAPWESLCGDTGEPLWDCGTVCSVTRQGLGQCILLWFSFLKIAFFRTSTRVSVSA